MSTKSNSAATQDAFALLKADHKAVKALFRDFDGLSEDGDDEQKADLVQQICNELTVHAQVEEELFYPAVRAAIDDADLLDEAAVEHASAKDLIAQLNAMEPGDELYDAKVTVLSEYIDHHVKEEEDEMFPKAQKSDLDARALGQEMLARKQELKAELGMVEEAQPIPAKRTNGSRQAAKPAK
jgi:hemerythrin superfamily protein